MGPAEVAGLVPVSYWNNASGTAQATPMNLVGQNGASTSATVTWKADNTYLLPTTDLQGNARMMRGYLDTHSGNPTVVNVAGLPATANGYRIYVYGDGSNNTATRKAIYQISGNGITTTNIGLTDAANNNFSGSFTQANNSNGNYVVFTVQATAFTLSAIPSTASDGTQRAPLNGIQIVAVVSSTPDFTMSAAPGSATAVQGGSTAYTVNVAATNGYNGSVNLSSSGLPSGVTASFAPTSVAPGSNSTMTVEAAANASVGTTNITIAGADGVLSRSTTASLTVASANTQSNVISLKFVGSGTPMGSTESAGVIAKSRWNNASGASSGTALNLVDELGNSTGATVVWRADGMWREPIVDQAGNFRMMRGYLDTSNTGTTSVTVNRLPTSARGYTLYVYCDGDNNTASRTGIYQISASGNSSSLTLTDAANTNFSSNFVQARNSNGNYLVFAISGSSFTLSATPGATSDGTRRAPVNGIQIVPNLGSASAVAPSITTQPANQTVTAGQSATFRVVASGTAPLSYQWLKNGTAISGASAASYSTPVTTTADSGAKFWVTVSNAAGSVTSAQATLTVNPSSALPLLRASGVNPRYFSDGTGKAVYLAGSHTWADLQDQGSPAPAVFDYSGYISFMKSHGFNLMHMWTWWFPNGGTAHEAPIQFTAAPYPWLRSGPGVANDGGAKFDFTQFDQGYFDRLRARVMQAGQNGIYVSIYLFNGYEFQFDVNSSDGNPFESSNNVNGISCPNTCPTDNSQISAQAWSFEKSYIEKVIDTVNDLDNVLYMTSNESGAPYSNSWQASVIAEVKSYEASKPKQHPVGMGFQYQGGSDQSLYNSAADWVSPAFGGGGLNVPPDATGQCPARTGNSGALNPSSPNCKVVVNDTDHDCGICGTQAWVWQNFTRGNNVLFMDAYLVNGFGNNPSGSCANNQCTVLDPQWNPVRNAMQDVLSYAAKMGLANIVPQDTLSSTGFVLANGGVEYLVYQSGSGAFTVNLGAATYAVEWFNPSTHQVASTGFLTASGGNQSFTPPFSGNAVLYLKAQ